MPPRAKGIANLVRVEMLRQITADVRIPKSATATAAAGNEGT